jgi:hypothetical protein
MLLLRYALTALAFFASFLGIGVAAFVMVIVLAGPHSDMLPPPLQVMAAIAGWLTVLVLPALVARRVGNASIAGVSPHIRFGRAHAARTCVKSDGDGRGVSAAEPER